MGYVDFYCVGWLFELVPQSITFAVGNTAPVGLGAYEVLLL